MRLRFQSPIWLWVKALLCLVAVDILLFRVGLVWEAGPDFGPGLVGENWRLLFAAARDIETRRPSTPTVVTVGSSVVIFGVDPGQVGERLRQDGVPQDFLRFVTHGSTATDSALMAWSSRTFEPWLVIYGAAVRDFPKSGFTDSGVVRTFYDASAELPRLPRAGVEDRLDAYARRYWKLYRYRFFTLRAVEAVTTKRLRQLGISTPSFAAEAPALSILPPEALQYFPPYRIMPKSWAAWTTWRQSRRFSDYLAWMQMSGSVALNIYKTQTLANFGPEGNVQVASLRWMLAALQQNHTRTVLLSFPENPVFRDPEARAYFDPSLSDAYAHLLRDEAEARGARYEDLRDLLQPEEFFDLVHANVIGQRKLSARIAAIIEEEWRARQALGPP
jgi:hypothetical protein